MTYAPCLSFSERKDDDAQNHHRAQGKEEYSYTVTHDDPEKANILPQLYLIKVLWTGFSACITDTKKRDKKAHWASLHFELLTANK